MEKSDLERAFEALSAKQRPYDLLWAYYDGEQPLVYSAERLATLFKNLQARFVQNWSAVIVDSAHDRIDLQGFLVANDRAATDRLSALFEETELALDADDVHRAAMVCGEAFVIVWKNEQGEVEAYYNDPRQCHAFYDDENPHEISFAAKWWRDGEGHWRIILYYPDRLDYYRTAKPVKNIGNMKGAKAFVPADPPTAPNPFGAVPVFHFRPERRRIKSDLANITTIQDAVNKLFVDMMISAEFGAFPQKWAISNADLDTLKNAPNEIWNIPAGEQGQQPSSVGQFAPTDLGNYLAAIDKLAATIAIIGRTPKHYVFAQGGDPSGEALIAMEAPLNKRVKRHIERFTMTWRKVAAFLLEVDGTKTAPQAVKPVFLPPETVQPLSQAQIRATNVQAGMPLTTVLKREGWSEEEVQAMYKDAQSEAAQKQTSLANALLDAQRRFDQGNGAGQEVGGEEASEETQEAPEA